jgi:hypothetical protein
MGDDLGNIVPAPQLDLVNGDDGGKPFRILGHDDIGKDTLDDYYHQKN